jgi:hypothetical protein
VLLILAGLVGLLFGLLPLAGKTLAARGMETTTPILFEGTILAGAFLLGAVNVGMILGHWYLLMRRLSFEYLERFAKLFLAAVAIRAGLVLIIATKLQSLDPKLGHYFIADLLAMDGHLFFFALRVLFGLIGPLVLGLMILRCVREKANQAATGLFYVAEISVLFGELFAAVLLI